MLFRKSSNDGSLKINQKLFKKIDFQPKIFGLTLPLVPFCTFRVQTVTIGSDSVDSHPARFCIELRKSWQPNVITDSSDSLPIQ